MLAWGIFLLWWTESQQKVSHFIDVLAGEKCLVSPLLVVD